ncbi:copper resistance protein CopC [Aeromicrobium sp. Leaf350]|uniref:copper resistance protein CopC n=1 Tax=Aeromicrobium sp. Leaf350 TaxID=2876565 RepID=UPI001E3FDF29|nr:copper resistance protein CopC [Aeromicrobium sp. Leaf350]
MTVLATTIRRARLMAVPVGLLLLAPVLAAQVLLASPAAAHASLVSTSPDDGEVLAESPAEIALTFTENVRLTDGIELLAGDGSPVEAEVSGADEVVTITPSAPLADGTYVVGWRVISADSHPIAGGFSFSVGAPSATSVDVPTAETPRDVDLLRKSAEALRYGGVLLAAGLVPFALLVAPRTRTSPAAARRLVRTAVVAGVVAVVAALQLVPLTALWQAGSPLSELGTVLADPRTWQDDSFAAAGVIFLALVVAGLAAARSAPALAVAAATVATSSLAIVGHTRTFGPVPVVLTADVAHVAVAATWAGGLAGLVVLFTLGSQVRADVVQQAVRRFSAVALWSVVVLTISGAVLWWRIPATVTDLPDSSYGVHLVVKVTLVAIILVVAAFNLRHLRGRRTVDLSVLRRTVGAELVVIGLVVAVTAGMVTQVPRSSEAAAATAPAAEEPEALELDLGDGTTATLVLTPGRVGTNAAQLTVTGADGAPVSAVEPVQLSVGIEEFELGPFRHELVEVSPGAYEGSIDLPIPGTWRIEVGVRTSTYERPSDSVDVEVAE